MRGDTPHAALSSKQPHNPTHTCRARCCARSAPATSSPFCWEEAKGGGRETRKGVGHCWGRTARGARRPRRRRLLLANALVGHGARDARLGCIHTHTHIQRTGNAWKPTALVSSGVRAPSGTTKSTVWPASVSNRTAARPTSHGSMAEAGSSALSCAAIDPLRGLVTRDRRACSPLLNQNTLAGASHCNTYLMNSVQIPVALSSARCICQREREKRRGLITENPPAPPPPSPSDDDAKRDNKKQPTKIHHHSQPTAPPRSTPPRSTPRSTPTPPGSFSPAL